MATRATRNELDEAFADFIRMLGAQVGNAKDNYRLDHSPNGYKIYRVMNEHGGIRPVFGDQRYSAGELLTMLTFAIHAMAISNDNETARRELWKRLNFESNYSNRP